MSAKEQMQNDTRMTGKMLQATSFMALGLAVLALPLAAPLLMVAGAGFVASQATEKVAQHMRPKYTPFSQ